MADKVYKLKSIDLTNFTFRKLEELETLSGLSLDMIGTPGVAKARLFRALAYFELRETDPSITFDELLDWAVEEPDEVEDPTTAVEENPTAS